jgi:hypothetical protein
MFHEYFHSGTTELRLSYLTAIKQKHNEHVSDTLGDLEILEISVLI